LPGHAARLFPTLQHVIARRKCSMFKGFGTAMVIVTGFLIGLPTIFAFAVSGDGWLERLDQMSPFF
jgi:hypothetical protein